MDEQSHQGPGWLAPWLQRSLLVVVPTGLTVFIISKIIGWGDTIATGVDLILGDWEATLDPTVRWLVDKVVALAMLLVVYAALYVMGTLLGIRFFQGIYEFFGKIVRSIPLLGPIYYFCVRTFTQLLSSLTQKQVGTPCVVNTPGLGGKMVALVTSFYFDESVGKAFGWVMLITAPNPIGGYLVPIPADQIWIAPGVRIQDVFQLNLGLGVLKVPAINQAIAAVLAGKGTTFAEEYGDTLGRDGQPPLTSPPEQ